MNSSGVSVLLIVPMNIEYLLYLDQCQYCRHLQAISLFSTRGGWAAFFIVGERRITPPPSLSELRRTSRLQSTYTLASPSPAADAARDRYGGIEGKLSRLPSAA